MNRLFQVWTCGLNTHYVLGIKPPPAQVLEPYQLKYFHTQIRGIGTGRYHTVVWGSESIFSWGLNGGQLGHNEDNGQYIIVPKMVLCLFKPQTIAVNNCATAVLSTHGKVCIFHDFQMLKVSAKHLSLTAISVTGGRLSNKLDSSISEENNKLRIIGLNEYGNLYIWQEANSNFLRCIFSINRSLNIFQMSLNLNEILFVTTEGEAFRGIVKYAKKKVPEEGFVGHKRISQNITESDHQLIKIIKIPNVHRAISIDSDFEGKNFAVLQVSPSALIDVPEISPSVMAEDILKLLCTSQNDSLQNVTFKISDRLFHVHQYIVATGSAKLYKIIKKNPSHFIEFSDAYPDCFEQIILYLYTHKHTSSEIDKLLENANVMKEDVDEIKLIEDSAILEMKTQNFNKLGSTKSTLKFSYTAFPELHDVVLKSKDDKLISVHGCILIARSEYFNNCFSIRWNENSTKNQEIPMPFPYNILVQLIEYLYTDELPLLSVCDLDQVCNLLIAADHMCIFRLKEICECTLCTFITLKNVGQILSFAANYCAEKLKHYSMEFVTLNLAPVLETRALEYLDDELLLELRDFYCNYYSFMQYRIITSYSIAPSDEVVMLASRFHSVVFEESYDESKTKSPPKSQKRRSRQRKSSSSENNKGKLSPSKEFSNEVETYSSLPVTSAVPIGGENVPSRIKAIVSAHDTINCDDIAAAFTKLKSTQVEISFDEFPMLSDNDNMVKHPKSYKNIDKVEMKQKITKVSQKERKRLSSIAENNVPQSPPVSESPKNPWKLVSETINSDKPVAVQSIIVEEKRQKENFVKMKFKHLTHIQIEDKAIEDLYKFYNADNVFDEIIAIGRVEMGAIATPQWLHKNRKN